MQSSHPLSSIIAMIHMHLSQLQKDHRYVFSSDQTIFSDSKHVKQVVNERDFKDFLHVPYLIYKDNPFWIAPLWNDEHRFFNTSNLFWTHATSALFIAYKKGKPVGRIAGIVDHMQEGTQGYFGFFESINDETTANALFSSVEHWLKHQHATDMIGPINGRVDNGTGFLINCFDALPTILDSYSQNYYPDLVQTYGFKPYRDLHTYKIDLRQPLSGELRKTARYTKIHHDIHIRNFHRWRTRSELNWWIPFFLSTFSHHWGYIPVGPVEVQQRYGIRNIRWAVDPNFFVIAEQNQTPIGFLWATPDYNQVFKKIRGRPTPFSILRFAWELKNIDYGKLSVIGIKKEYQNKQLAMLLNYEVLRRMQKKGYRGADIGWIDSQNRQAQKVMEKTKAEHTKTFRVYTKMIT